MSALDPGLETFIDECTKGIVTQIRYLKDEEAQAVLRGSIVSFIKDLSEHQLSAEVRHTYPEPWREQLD